MALGGDLDFDTNGHSCTTSVPTKSFQIQRILYTRAHWIPGINHWQVYFVPVHIVSISFSKFSTDYKLGCFKGLWP